MRLDDVVIQGKLVIDGRIVEGQVIINGSRIIGLRKNGRADYKTASLIFPGFIDVHTHMREPGWEYKEDFRSGSEAASNGGVTVAFDMPNNPKPLTNLERLEEKIELSKKSVIPIKFYGGVKDEFVDMPVIGYKIYLAESTGKLMTANLERVIKQLNGKFVSFHCELPDYGNTSKSEVEAIKLVKTFKGITKNVCHVSTRKGLDLCENLYCEVTPHHLYFTEDDNWRMLPPLREKNDRNYLLKNIGRATFLTTDHAPHLPEENLYGVPGLDTYGAFVGWLIKKGVSLENIINLTSKNANEVFGLNNYLRTGGDANLTILELKDYKVKDEELKTKCGWSPFEGEILGGKVEGTVINGRLTLNN